MLKYKIETSLYLLHQCRHGGRGQMAAKSDNCITAYYSRDMWFGGHKAGRVTALPCGIIASTQGWKETVVLSRCVLQVGIPGILLEFSRAGTESVITSVTNLCSPKRLASLLGKVNALALHKVYSPNWDSSMPGITLGLTQSQQPHGRESRPCRAEAVLLHSGKPLGPWCSSIESPEAIRHVQACSLAMVPPPVCDSKGKARSATFSLVQCWTHCLRGRRWSNRAWLTVLQELPGQLVAFIKTVRSEFR